MIAVDLFDLTVITAAVVSISLPTALHGPSAQQQNNFGEVVGLDRVDHTRLVRCMRGGMVVRFIYFLLCLFDL